MIFKTKGTDEKMISKNDFQNLAIDIGELLKGYECSDCFKMSMITLVNNINKVLYKIKDVKKRAEILTDILLSVDFILYDEECNDGTDGND